jgi:hypothetical protein|tara:strand:+ start:629 stop:847 length:219 start_codon:yes stop_codon:yes gene_type:complete
MKFQVSITFNDNIIHEKVYNSMREVADGLGMTYQQVADINCGRVTPKFISRDFPYQPNIKINKVLKKEINIV